jgi:hypothetical protein
LARSRSSVSERRLGFMGRAAAWARGGRRRAARVAHAAALRASLRLMVRILHCSSPAGRASNERLLGRPGESLAGRPGRDDERHHRKWLSRITFRGCRASHDAAFPLFPRPLIPS